MFIPFIQFHPFHLFSSTFIHFHPCHPLLSISSRFIHFHQISSSFIHFIHFHPFCPHSSTFIHFHWFSFIFIQFIHFHPLSSISSTFIHVTHFHLFSFTFIQFPDQCVFKKWPLDSHRALSRIELFLIIIPHNTLFRAPPFHRLPPVITTCWFKRAALRSIQAPLEK